MNKTKLMLITLTYCLISFGGGFSLGYYLSKNKYLAKADKEIDDVKKLYEKYFDNKNNKNNNEDKKSKSDIAETKQYTDYADKYKGDKDGDTSDILKTKNNTKKKAPNTKKRPYVIDGLQFGELEGYEIVTLLYYKDKVLTYESGSIIENPNDIIGTNALNSFGENDSTYVRDDENKIDYEILLDERPYYNNNSSNCVKSSN